MNQKQGAIGNRDSEMVIYKRYDVVRYDVMKEHPMIRTEPEYIRRKVKEQKRKKGHSAKIGKERTVKTDEIEKGAQDCND